MIIGLVNIFLGLLLSDRLRQVLLYTYGLKFSGVFLNSGL